MSNLDNFNNIYANLAESAYNNRPNNFPPYSKKITETPLNYSNDSLNKKGEVQVHGGTHLPNKGIVYLQPE